MPRKKKSYPPAKSKAIHFRVTDDMYQIISDDAAKAHLSVSAYCRDMVLNRKITIHQEMVFDCTELLTILGDMGKIGSNLNQIAHHLNSEEPWTNNIKSEVMQAIIALYKIRDMIKALAGEYRERT